MLQGINDRLHDTALAVIRNVREADGELDIDFGLLDEEIAGAFKTVEESVESEFVWGWDETSLEWMDLYLDEEEGAAEGEEMGSGEAFEWTVSDDEGWLIG
jgi:hypothetical protein